jgi:hypothetical protein
MLPLAAAGLEEIKYAIQDSPEAQRLGAARFAPLERLQQRNHALPKTIRNFPAAHKIAKILTNQAIIHYPTH